MTDEEKLWHQRLAAKVVSEVTGDVLADPMEPPEFIAFREPGSAIGLIDTSTGLRLRC